MKKVKSSETSSSAFKLLLFLVVLSATCHIGACLTANVESSPSTVSTSSQLKITIDAQVRIPSDGKIEITIPSTCSITQTNPLTCEFAQTTGVTPTCTSSGQVISVTLSGELSGIFQLNINGFVNAPYDGATPSFQVKTLDSTGTQIEAKTQNVILYVSHGVLQTATIVPNNKTVGVVTDATVTITPGHLLQSGSLIRFTFPLWNSDAPSYLQEQMVVSSTPQCEAINGGNLANGFTCVYDTIAKVLSVQNGITADINAGTPLIFTLKGLRNPLSTSPSPFNIIAKTETSTGRNIDQKTISITASTAQTIFTTTVSSATTTVQELGKFRVQFTSPVPLETGCLITVQFPTDLAVTGNLATTIGMSLFGASRALTFTKNLQLNQITVLDGCNGYKNNDLDGILFFEAIENPITTKPTSGISITIYDKNQFLIAQTGSTTSTYTATTGAISTMTASVLSNTVNTQTSLTLNFKPAHQVPSTSASIIIAVPTGFTIADRVTASCTLSNTKVLSNSATCSVANKVITILNPFDFDYNPSLITQDISFMIDGVTLQGYAGTTGAFTVTTKQGTYLIDSGSKANLFQIAPAILANTAATADSPHTLDLSTYTFSIKTTNLLFQGGNLMLKLPSQVTIPTPTQSACTFTTGFEGGAQCTITASQVIIKDGFQNSNIAAGHTFTWTVTKIRNPRSTKPTSSFEFFTRTAANAIIDEKTVGTTVSMTQTGAATGVTVNSVSKVVGKTTVYTITATPTIQLVTGDKIQLTAPLQINPASSVTCSGDGSILATSLPCTSSNKDVYVTINPSSGSTIASGTGLTIQISTLTNPSSTSPSSNFIFKFVTTDLFTLLSFSGTLSVTMTTPAPIVTRSVTHQSNQASAVTTFTIAFNTVHTIPAGGAVRIIYPSQLSVESTQFDCTANVGTPSCSLDTSTRTILVKNAFSINFAAGAQVQVQLYGVKNSAFAAATDSFQVLTLTTDGLSATSYQIDQATSGMTVENACDFPCKLCDSNSKSTCLSCYVDATNNILSGTTCVSSCPKGQIEENYQCVSCNAKCVDCQSNNKDVCTECGKTNYEFLMGKTCQSTCPDGYYGDLSNNRCMPCSQPCKTCNGSPTTCTSCIINTNFQHYWNNQCLATCPDGTIPHADTEVCIDCDQNCKTCQDSINLCTSCDSGLLLNKISSQCVATCPAQTTVKIGSECQACDEQCLTCSGSISSCDSCSDGLLLTTDHKCGTSCKSNEVPINDICTPCFHKCATCDTTTTKCPTCLPQYVFYNLTCLDTCPTGYEPNSNKKCVLAGLQCPFGYVVNDAGDKCILNNITCNPGYKLDSTRQYCVPIPPQIVPFPLLITGAVFTIVVIISKCKDRNSLLRTNLIIFYSILEMASLLVQMILAIKSSSFGIFGGTFVGFIALLASNILFFILYEKHVKKDSAFKHWAQIYRCTAKTVPIFSLIINFKCFRLFYSRLFGLDHFQASFQNPDLFYKPFAFVTVMQFVFGILPIIVTDIVSLFYIVWGYQLLIACIESFVYVVIITFLTIIEFRHVKSELAVQKHKNAPKLLNDSNVMSAVNLDDESSVYGSNTKLLKESRHRKRALMELINKISKQHDLSKDTIDSPAKKVEPKMSHREESRSKIPLQKADTARSRIGEPEKDYGPEEDYDREKALSWPPSPRAIEKMDDPRFRDRIEAGRKILEQANYKDNVYAEAKPKKALQSLSGVTSTKGVQTYNPEYHGPDFLQWLDDDAELHPDYTSGLIQGVLDNLSDPEGRGKKRWRKPKRVSQKRKAEIPEFDLHEIMGEFDIDDLGNLIIVNDKGKLLDRMERRVNKRGYLMDKYGNIVNQRSKVIFTQEEVDSDGEIPAPYCFEKRKKQLLQSVNLFKVEELDHETDIEHIDDEEMIEKELRKIKDMSRVSSVDSLMGETPSKFDQKNMKPNVEMSPRAVEPPKAPEQMIDSLDEAPDETLQIIEDVRKKVQDSIDAECEEQDRLDEDQMKKIEELAKVQEEANEDGMHKRKRSADGRKPINKKDVKMARAYGGQAKGAKENKVGTRGRKKLSKDSTKPMFPSLAEVDVSHEKLFKLAGSIQGGGFKDPVTGENVWVESPNDLEERFQQLRREMFNTDLNQMQEALDALTQDRMLERRHQQQLENELTMHASKIPKPDDTGRNRNRRQESARQSRKKSRQNPSSHINRVYGHIDDFLGSPLMSPGQTTVGGGAGNAAMMGLSPKIGNLLEAPMGPRTQSHQQYEQDMQKEASLSRLQERAPQGKIKNLENVYMQKVDGQRKGLGTAGQKVRQGKKPAKFRDLQHKFVDDFNDLTLDDPTFNQQEIDSLVHKLSSIGAQPAVASNNFVNTGHQSAMSIPHSQSYSTAAISKPGGATSAGLSRLGPGGGGNAWQ